MITKAIVDQKRLATLTARAALAGVVLHRIDDDRGREVYIVSRWALTREMRSLEEVSTWLDGLAATPASAAREGAN